MKKVHLLGIVFLMSIIVAVEGFAAGISTPDQAFQAAVEQVCRNDADGLGIFVTGQVLKEGTVIETWRGPFLKIDRVSWFVFIDNHPGANWEHPCRYVLVDPGTGECRVTEGTRPPEFLKDMIRFSGPDPFSGYNRRSGVSKSFAPRSGRSPAHLWAVILSGGASQGSNHIRYWNDCSEIYQTLVDVYGYLDDHIIVAISDGLDPTPDQSSGGNSDPDLDGDGDDDIMYSCTLANLNLIFTNLASSLGSQDTLFIFTTDHGNGQYGVPGQPTSMNLWNGEIIWDYEFAALLNPVNCREIIVTMEPCFSGGFVNDVVGMSSSVPRVISTAANDMEYSWAMGPDYLYDTYVFHWTAAVRWVDAYGTPVDADTNDDGEVTMDEAYAYALMMDLDDEHPQYGEWPTDYGDNVTLAGSGATSEGEINLDRSYYMCTDTINIILEDLDLQGQGSVQITVKSTTESDGELRTLTETDVAHFEGSITTATGSPSSDGVLQVTHGDTITAEYLDQSYGGAGQMLVTDTAQTDCVMPVISNVAVNWVTAESAQIIWMTNEPADSRVDYGMTPVPSLFTEDDTLVTSHAITLEGLAECTDYVFSVTSADQAGNSATDNNSGSYYAFQTHAIYMLLDANMDTNPGWTFEGQWAWGQPAGLGGDPSSGNTGLNVVGYNLNGTYSNSMPVYTTTTGSFNCSGASSAVLKFWRWLGVESSSYDHASIQISNNGGSTWNDIWVHSGPTIIDTSWTYLEYDISTHAAYQSDVRIRWSMGPTDGSVIYSGWNIDDVEISYTAPCNAPNLIHHSHAINDSAGNNDGQINPGESILMPVTLQNLGLDATGVNGNLTTLNTNVTITSAGSTYPDIPQSGTGTSNANYAFTVSGSAVDNEIIPFTLSWSSLEGSGSTSFQELVVAPSLEFDTVYVLDGSGDADGYFDPGESVQLQVYLQNIGHGTAHNVTATLSSNQPGYITITDNQANFGDIAGLVSGSSQAPHFSVTASPSTPDGTVITFTLNIGATGYSTSDTFDLKVTTSTMPVYDHILLLNEQCNSSMAHYPNALNRLGYSFTETNSDSGFLTQLTGGTAWDLILVDEYSNTLSNSTITALTDYITGGGRCILDYWAWNSALAGTFEASLGSTIYAPITIYRWETSHDLFTYPNSVPDMAPSQDDCNADGAYFNATGGGYAIAGYTASPQASQHCLVVGNDEKTIIVGEIPGLFTADTDSDTIPDMQEFLENAIVYVGGSIQPPSTATPTWTPAVTFTPTATQTTVPTGTPTSIPTSTPTSIPTVTPTAAISPTPPSPTPPPYVPAESPLGMKLLITGFTIILLTGASIRKSR